MTKQPPKFKPPSLPLHESFVGAERQRELGLAVDEVVISVPAITLVRPGPHTTKRTPGELSSLRAVAKSRGYRWVSDHAELILAQAYELRLDKEI